MCGKDVVGDSKGREKRGLPLVLKLVLLSLAAASVVSALTFLYYVDREIRKGLVDGVSYAGDALDRIAPSASLALWTYDDQALRKVLTGLRNDPMIDTAIISSERGEVKESLFRPQKSHRATFFSRPLLSTQDTPSLVVRKPLSYLDPRTGKKVQVGYLAVGASLEAVADRTRARVADTGFGILIAGSGFTVALLLVSILLVTRPISTLTRRVDRFDSGNKGSLDVPTAMLRRRDEIGRLARVIIQAFETLKRQSAEAEESRRRLKELLDGSIQAYIVVSDFKLLFVNEAAAQMFGYENADAMMVECDYAATFKKDEDGKFIGFSDKMASAREGETVIVEQQPRIRRDGNEILVRAHGRKFRWDGLPAVQVTLVDITDRVQAETELRNLATRDPLTGLPNKTLFLEQIGWALQESEGRPVAVMLIDINRMKVVNDMLGMSGGDAVIRVVGERLAELADSSNFVARFPGGEFAVISTDDVDNKRLQWLAGTIARLIGDPIRIEEKEITVSASFGIAVWPFDGRDPASLMVAAENACQIAKMDRSRGAVFASDRMNRDAARRYELEHMINRAIRNNEFKVYYQPKIDSLSGEVMGAKALLRWPQGAGYISPDEFIPVAEDCGSITELGQHVLRIIAADMQRMCKEHRMEVPVAFNASFLQFKDERFVHHISGILKEYEVPPTLFHVEITESATMEELDAVIPVLKTLRQLGMKIAIDDFGTGYSSLSQLKRLPVDYLKLDKSFTDDIVREDAQTIASAIVSLGHSLGLRVIAEGVETKEQAELLRKLGYDEFQGYLYSRPCPLEEFIRYYNGISSNWASLGD